MNMIQNKDLTDEQLKLYKKIFCRHLKENGLYYIIKRKLFNEKKIDFNDYIRVINGKHHVINGIVPTFWTPFGRIINNPVSQSLFLLDIISDEDFVKVFSNEKYFEKDLFNNLVKQAAFRELTFLLTHVSFFNKGFISDSQAIRLKDFIKLYHYSMKPLTDKIKFILNYGK